MSAKYNKSNTDKYEDKEPSSAKSHYVRHQKHRPALGEWIDDLGY